MGSSPGSGDWGVGNGERDTEGSGEFAREWGLGSWKWGVGPPVSGDQGVKMRVMVRERVSKNEGDGEGEGESEGEGEKGEGEEEGGEQEDENDADDEADAEDENNNAEASEIGDQTKYWSGG